jgi:ABC-type multidrug transport system fused ATPase/permease subunit
MTTLRKHIGAAMQRDLFMGLPFVPLYSAAEVCLGFAVAGLLQLVFQPAASVDLKTVMPDALLKWIPVGWSATVTRADLTFAIPAILVGAGLVKLISGFASSYLIERAGHRVAHALRQEFLGKFLSSQGNTLDSLSVDEMATRLQMDTTLLQNSISKGSVSVLRDGCLVIFLLISMFVMAFQIMLFSLFVLIPLFLFLRFMARRLTFYAQESASRQVQLGSQTLQIWSGRLTLHALRAQLSQSRLLEQSALRFYHFIRGSFFLRTAFRPGTEMMALALLAVLLSWKFSSPTVFDASTLTTLFVLGALAFRPLKQVSGVIALTSDIKAVYDRLDALWDSFDSSATEKTNDESSFPSHIRPPFALQTQDLCIVSPRGDVLVKPTTLEIPWGQKVAIVGPSGAGKSTFLRAIASLFDYKSGTLQVGEPLLMATQQPYVFKGTVRENVLYRDMLNASPTGAEEEALRTLLLKLRLAHSSTGVQMTLEKNLGFLGEGLSGGEKARVALARLLFLGPKILLLDEPTANLDAASTAAFWEAVADWHRKDSENTVIAVSHSVGEWNGFERFLTFDEGVLVRDTQA